MHRVLHQPRGCKVAIGRWSQLRISSRVSVTGRDAARALEGVQFRFELIPPLCGVDALRAERGVLESDLARLLRLLVRLVRLVLLVRLHLIGRVLVGGGSTARERLRRCPASARGTWRSA